MNKSLFTSFMRSPLALPAESTKMLEEVVKEFPYCQTAQLLFLKSLHLQNSIHYNSQLKVAAAFATDRSVLYHLITKKEIPALQTSSEKPVEKTASRNDEQIVAELKLPPVKEPVKPESETNVPPVKVETKPQLGAQEILEARLRELNAEKKETPPLAKIQADKIPSPQPVIEQEKAALVKPVEEEKVKDIPQKKIIPNPEPGNLTEPIDTDDTLKTEKDLETLSDDYISTAIDASMRIEIEIEEATPPSAQEQKEPDIQHEDAELSFYAWLKKSNRSPEKAAQRVEDEQKSEERKQLETNLIDRFIKEEPKISKPKKEFYNPVNMARQSVVEDLDFVTETLAGIYAKQGNTAKAIRAYQTLSLKYPEKKLYFASLIEKLEGESK
jgi:hypothetical protein